jgi:hypothetical protein
MPYRSHPYRPPDHARHPLPVVSASAQYTSNFLTTNRLRQGIVVPKDAFQEQFGSNALDKFHILLLNGFSIMISRNMQTMASILL